MTAPTIIVAGLGRCGSSLTMQMLSAAGLPTIGTYPDFECTENRQLLVDDPEAWRDAVAGKAVKVLDVHRTGIPPILGARIIWLDRDRTEQAKSQLKILSSAFSTILAQDNRESRRAMEASLRRDREASLALLRRTGSQVRRPCLSAETIGTLFDADEEAVDRMAEVVIPRTPGCLPYILEYQLVQTGAMA